MVTYFILLCIGNLVIICGNNDHTLLCAGKLYGISGCTFYFMLVKVSYSTW
jgi:intracellular septation protein A